jgi:hypothetical protein
MKRTHRNVQKHKRLVSREWFRIYYSGSYALWEIDFGRLGHNEFVILLGCVDRLVKVIHNKPLRLIRITTY